MPEKDTPVLDKLASVEARYDQLMTEMADPAVQGDSSRFRSHSKALAEIQPLIEAEFGQWAAPSVSAGVKQFSAPPARPGSPRIVLVNRPDSPQSVISGGQITPADPRNNIEALIAANDVLGGNFLSRINMDLREAKGWSYGVRGSAQLSEKAVPYVISAPVQADRTGDALAELNSEIGAFLSTRGVTEDELKRAVANSINSLPGDFETAGAVISAMMRMDLFDRPDDYYDRLPGKYRALTPASADSAIRAAIDLLAANPEIGNETNHERAVRRWPIREYPYAIFYSVDRSLDAITIVRVIASARVKDLRKPTH